MQGEEIRRCEGGKGGRAGCFLSLFIVVLLSRRYFIRGQKEGERGKVSWLPLSWFIVVASLHRTEISDAAADLFYHPLLLRSFFFSNLCSAVARVARFSRVTFILEGIRDVWSGNLCVGCWVFNHLKFDSLLGSMILKHFISSLWAILIVMQI